MKSFFLRSIPLGIIAYSSAYGQTYTNYIRQWQIPSGVSWNASDAVMPSGEKLSTLPVGEQGARFDLWTVLSSPLTDYLLETKTVGSYVPVAKIVIDTTDPYGKASTATGSIPANVSGDTIRRTRVDKPINVYVTVSGLRTVSTEPLAQKSVNFYHHAQSGSDPLDTTKASLLTTSSITSNDSQSFSYPVGSIPVSSGGLVSKQNGEERFSIFTLNDYQKAAYQLASQTVKVFPIADGSIRGVTSGALINDALPPIIATVRDLYPGDSACLTFYPGPYVKGKIGPTELINTLKANTTNAPMSFELTASYDEKCKENGQWTVVLYTTGIYGVEELFDRSVGTTGGGSPVTSVTFNVARTMEINGGVTTID